MWYVDILIPANVSLPRPGERITINAFTPRSSTHEILHIREGSPRILGTVTIEVGSEGIDIPASAMIQTDQASWASREAIFVAQEDPASMANFTYPGTVLPQHQAPASFGIDWEGLRQEVDRLILSGQGRGEETLQFQVGEKILELILQPILNSFVGCRTDAAEIEIHIAWDQAVKLIKSTKIVQGWLWDQLEERLLDTAERAIRYAIQTAPTAPAPPAPKLKVERLDAPWLRDE